MTRPVRRAPFAVALLACLTLAALVATPVAGDAAAQAQSSDIATYTNPLDLRTPEGERVETCADPSIAFVDAESGERTWYLYCTTDPFNGDDRDESGELNFHLIPTFTSTDLIHWIHAGDVFDERPEWMGDGGPWAPEIVQSGDTWFMYYTAPDVPLGDDRFGSAIGVATAPSPTGPWTDSGGPVVEPHAPPGNPDADPRWVFDPEVITATDGQRYLYYGSYYGGLSVRELSADGLTTDPATQSEVAIGDRYEGTQIVQRDGYYYLLASATNCCAGPLTGYSVFAGRSRDPRGPFLDREGVSLLSGRVGGTPVLSMNGNRWVGPGHHDVFTDFSGQDWMIYHALDRDDPYLAEPGGINKRPALMDPLDWIDGWPTVRNGHWASERPKPAPAAQPGDRTRHHLRVVRDDEPLHLIRRASDEFDGDGLHRRWSWVREPSPDSFGLADGAFGFDTQAADLFVDSNNASVLLEDTPRGAYMVETRMRLDVPAEGCCFNFTQGGLVIYGDDDNFIKLAHVSIWGTRQTEFAKEESPVPDGHPRYGNTVVGPPDDWTYLRIARRLRSGEEHYTAYTSRDGEHWVRGGTWAHDLGIDASIGLVSMGGAGFRAEFDYVRVYRIQPRHQWY
ncbi:MAG: family 43 glycosylhydrolase [Actinomycetota bacterium]|jgi:arabinan endo-1,5-alpha-L-arabinosidase|nr:family 43 glycosylhydrolase [Euzebyaceae bacterium]MDQ3431508.1 family 43 glycosylhydrolase [Actinomycetota bacterium]